MAIETPLAKLEKELGKPDQPSRPKTAKIQRVVHHIRNRESFVKYYLPKLLSIGPIHHRDENLQLGEQYKLKLTARYVKRTQQQSAQSPTETAQTLYKTIKDKIEALKGLFAEDVIRGITDDELSWMLFVDGCSLLQILEKPDFRGPGELDLKVDQLVLVVQDVLLLENQLPFQVLKLLSSSQDNESSMDIEASEDNEAEAKLIETMDKFLQDCCDLSPHIDRPAERAGRLERAANCCLGKGEHHGQEFRMQVTQPVSPTHLLDRLRTNVLGPDEHTKGNNNKTRCSGLLNRLRNKFQCLKEKGNKNSDNQNKMRTHRNIQELKAAGIKMKTSKSRCLGNISFYSHGLFGARLKLPEIVVDDATVPTLMNLIAYEMWPDFENNYGICSFVAFMDSLIDHPEDVKELRSAGVLFNALGSDEEVASLFNTISTDLVIDAVRYADVRSRIEGHYTNKWNTWMSEAYHTYFSNPWALLGFVAAVFVLLLTCVQTWYAIPH